MSAVISLSVTESFSSCIPNHTCGEGSALRVHSLNSFLSFISIVMSSYNRIIIIYYNLLFQLKDAEFQEIFTAYEHQQQKLSSDGGAATENMKLEQLLHQQEIRIRELEVAMYMYMCILYSHIPKCIHVVSLYGYETI